MIENWISYLVMENLNNGNFHKINKLPIRFHKSINLNYKRILTHTLILIDNCHMKGFIQVLANQMMLYRSIGQVYL